MQSDQPGLVGERGGSSRRGRRWRATTTSPIRGTHGGDPPARTSRARSPRRGSAPRPRRRAPRARSRRPSTAPAAAVEVPEPRLAAEQRDAVTQRGGRSSTSTRSSAGDVDHAVVGDDDEPTSAGASRAAARPHGRPSRSCVRHACERHAVAVARSSRGRRRRRRSARFGPRRAARPRSARRPVGADVVRARAAPRDVSPTSRELRACSPPSSRRPRAGSRSKTVGCGCHSRGRTALLPLQRVEQLVGARDAGGVADDAVAAGRQRRCRAR